MRTQLTIVAVLACSAFFVASPTASAAEQQTPPTTLSDAAKMTLSGCLDQPPRRNSPFTFADVSEKGKTTTYRLSGIDVKGYFGRRITIVGGLVPSPNVAAQVGALSAMESSMVGAGGSASGTRPATLPEFRVKSVRVLQGSCPSK
jgi:hypothetical protein